MAVWCLGLHFSSVSCLIFMRPWWGAILWDLVWHLKPCFSGDFPGVELDTETRFSLISWIPIEGLIQFLSHWIWSGCAVVCHRRDWVTSHMVAWWPWSARRWRLSFGNPLFAHFTPSSRSQQSARSPVTWCCWSTMTGGMYFKCISTALLSRVASRHGGSGDS